jgi:DNA-binding MarR family transcriptional regulator
MKSQNVKELTASQSVFWELTQLMYQSKHRSAQIAEEYRLTVMQSWAILLLTEDNPLPMRRLSDVFMCDASTITGLVDRLEARGIIHRQSQPNDRRIKLIALTPEGAALKAAIQAKTEAAESERLNHVLSPAERRTLHELLARVLASPQAIPD